MSSFLVSNETINRVVHFLDLDCCGCSKGNIGKDGDELGQQLWKLNNEATCFRYRHPVDELPPFRWSPRANLSLVVMLKAANCWQYQCSEGDQFQNHPLYLRVDKQIEVIQSVIISRLKEYDDAPWDAPHSRDCSIASYGPRSAVEATNIETEIPW